MSSLLLRCLLHDANRAHRCLTLLCIFQQVDVLSDSIVEAAAHFERGNNPGRVRRRPFWTSTHLLNTLVHLPECKASACALQVESSKATLKELIALEASIKAHSGALKHIGQTYAPSIDSDTDFKALLQQRVPAAPEG